MHSAGKDANQVLRQLCMLGALAAFVAGCKGGMAAFGNNVPKIGKAEKGTLEVVLSEVGSIEPESKIEVKSLLGGKVQEVLVHPGDVVKARDVLALVQPEVDQITNLSQIRSSLEKVRVDLKNAEIDFHNEQELIKQKLVSDQELRQARQRFEDLKADDQALESQARMLEEGGISLPTGDGVAAEVKAFKITAPEAGVILENRVQAGEVVASGTFAFGGGGSPLFILADLSRLLIKATVNEVDIGRVATGEDVTVTVDAYRGENFPGKVTRVSPGARLNGNVRVFDLEAKVSDPKTLLRPGMTANLDVHGERKEGALKVPIEGVFRKKGKDIVYLAKHLDKAAIKKKVAEDMKAGTNPFLAVAGFDFEEKEVKTGLATVEEIEILSGLSPGEEIFLEDPTMPRKEPGFGG